MDPNVQKMRAAPAAPRRYDGQAGNPLYDPQQGGHYGTSDYNLTITHIMARLSDCWVVVSHTLKLR